MPFIYLFLCPFLYTQPPSAPDIFGSCQIGSKAHQLQMDPFSLSQTSPLEEVCSQKKASVWLEIANSTDFSDTLLYVSNQHLNLNVSLAPAGVIGPESVCVCLTPKCLKCPLSAPLSVSLSTPLSFPWLCCWCICRRHNIRTLVQLIEPICCTLLPLSPYPLDNTLSHNNLLVPLLYLTKKMSSFYLNTPFLMHFIPCAIYFYLGQSLSSPLGPMNSASFFAASTLTKKKKKDGALEVWALGQVSFLAPHPSPPSHVPMTLTSFLHHRNETSWK